MTRDTTSSTSRLVACNIRFFATALESKLSNHINGGTAYLTMEVKREKMQYYGFDKNETRKLHCYYMTNKCKYVSCM